MQGMRDLLRGSLGKSLHSLTPLDRLTIAWPVACGSVLASRGEPVAYERGRLTVRVADPAWREQLHSSRGRLSRELARIASVELREIHFEGVPGNASRPAGPGEKEPDPHGNQR